MIITELIKDGNNIIIKDSVGNIAVFASLGTYAHKSICVGDVKPSILIQHQATEIPQGVNFLWIFLW